MKQKKVFGVNLNYSKWQSKDVGYDVYSVYGEDPNCDFGGHHHTPFLGNVEGTFVDVLEYAANEMSGFYQWGGGGHIVPYKLLNEASEPVILNKAKKLKTSRKEKLNKLVSADIEKLIEEFEEMSNEDIKNTLLDIKNKIILGKNNL